MMGSGSLDLGPILADDDIFSKDVMNRHPRVRQMLLATIFRWRDLDYLRLWLKNSNDLDLGMQNHPIHEATEAGWAEGVRLLLDHGVDVNCREHYFSWTPLHAAASGNEPLVLKLLVARGADLNAKATDGETALHTVTWQKYGLQSAKLLIEYGADINASDNESNTPLATAVSNGNWAMVRLLLEHGAEPTSKEEIVGAIKRFLDEDLIVHVNCPGCNASIHHSIEPFEVPSSLVTGPATVIVPLEKLDQ